MPEFDSTVEYRDIAGHPGYKVGNDGSVWTCKRFVGLPGHGGMKSVLSDKWKKMRPHPINKFGHLAVNLRPENNWRLVHRLVLEAFIGPCPKGYGTRHFPDRNPTNNHISNLQWGTRSENMLDKRLQGTSARGEGFYAPKLNNAKVRIIRKRLLSGESQAKIALDFGVHPSVISKIHHRKTWNHV